MTFPGCATPWRNAEIEIKDINANLKLLDPHIPIPGYSGFIGSYLVCGNKNAVVDPGPSSAERGLLAALAVAGLAPRDINYIILTHIHIDHAGGTGSLIKAMPNASVIVHRRAFRHLADPAALWNASLKTLGDLAVKYGPIEAVPEDRIIMADDLMQIDFGGGLSLQVYFTPGHAVHHMSLFDRRDSVLLAGEAAGVCVDGAIRPATPPPFKLEEAVASIDRLIALAPDKICYGHFGCFDDGLARLKQYRDKLYLWYETARGETSRGTAPEAILGVLRKKDPDLAYLDKMNQDEMERELVLLNNSIYGMAGITR
jgi:glyoxylase-like metal-dependent hydrolase (beta-lactamase superfamily II)